MEWMSHRKPKETKQQPGTAGPAIYLAVAWFLTVSCGTSTITTLYAKFHFISYSSQLHLFRRQDFFLILYVNFEVGSGTFWVILETYRMFLHNSVHWVSRHISLRSRKETIGRKNESARGHITSQRWTSVLTRIEGGGDESHNSTFSSRSLERDEHGGLEFRLGWGLTMQVDSNWWKTCAKRKQK